MKLQNAVGVEQPNRQLSICIIDAESGGNRRKLVREVEKEGVKWQPQFERR